MALSSCVSKEYKKSRIEREKLEKGNREYSNGKYDEALGSYNDALAASPTSLPATFNASLAALRGVPALPDSLKEEGMQFALEGFKTVAQHEPPSEITSFAYYNMGNMFYNVRQLDEAIEFYKQALRINPEDANARRNLRIAQLNRQQQQDNQQNNQQDNEQNQDNQQDNKDNQQDNNNDENKQDQQDKQDSQNNQQPQQQPQQPRKNQDSSDRILQRSQNKENELRQQLYKNAANDAVNSRHRLKKW